MTPDDIRRAIAGFPRWHYRFDLAGQVTPIWREDQANRHEQRVRYFFDPMVAVFGGSLAGKRVLDLGCNAGFFALRAIDAGCEFVFGIDGRQMHVDQANFVFEVNEVDRARYEFVCDDIYRVPYERLGPFDVVLCLGLLYHINKPVELLERVAPVNTDVCIVDTALSLAPGAYFELRYESTDVPANALDQPLVLYPTASAVAHLLRQAGYAVGMLRPRFSDSTGCWDYEQRKRRAFIAARDPSRLAPPFEFEEPESVRPHRSGGPGNP